MKSCICCVVMRQRVLQLMLLNENIAFVATIGGEGGPLDAAPDDSIDVLLREDVIERKPLVAGGLTVWRGGGKVKVS